MRPLLRLGRQRPTIVAAAAALAVVACGGGSNRTMTEAATTRAAALAVAEPGTAARALHEDYALYDEPYRPQLQFSPARNWMNDPNGLVYFDGEYHMFYQYNPDGTTWGDMSWGHAVSTDLVHWQELPVALPVQKDANGNATQMFFSGSVVVDKRNTSGFGQVGAPAMVAIYTSYYPQALTLPNGKTVQAGTQAQSLAYSTDRGRTWTLYDGDPVIPLPPPPYQDQYQNFRDPKVFWYAPQKKWVMVAALSQLDKAVLYSSTNLKDWTFMSEFGPANAVGGVWECPDLFELPIDGDKTHTKWVMVVNLNPGSVAGGSGAQYFTGSFDGTTFTPDSTIDNTPPPGTTFADFEADTYAAAGWATTGDFVGAATAAGSLPGQLPVTGYIGARLANTFTNGDASTGTITSPTFTIGTKYIDLLVGGGRHPHEGGTIDGTVPPGTLLFPGADLEGAAGATYADLGWTPSGDFVGQQVANGTLPGQQQVSGFEGNGLVNSFFGALIGEGGDQPTGSLTSPSFTIAQPYINFLIGGGSHPYGNGDATAVALVVDGAVLRSATGQDDETLRWTNWDVHDLIGKTAQIVVLDQNAGGWGHINADEFEASDSPAYPATHETTVNLVVDGTVVASETGENSEALTWRTWSVGAWMGKPAQIQIVDANTGGWGHVLVDQITFSDQRKDIANWIDWGADAYAVSSWNNLPNGRRVWTSWLNNWDYGGGIPTSPWRGAQSFAREVRLATVDGAVKLVQQPVAALRSLRLPPALSLSKQVVAEGETPLDVVNPGGQPAEIHARFAPGSATGFGLKVLTGLNGDETVIGYDVGAGEVYIDRTASGDASFSTLFAARHAAPLPLRGGVVELKVIVDRSSVTVFSGEGDVVLTDQVFPDPSSIGMSVFADGGSARLRQLTVWPLQSIWPAQ